MFFRATISERLLLENYNSVKMLSSGNRQLTFSTQKVKKEVNLIIYIIHLYIKIILNNPWQDHKSISLLL